MEKLPLGLLRFCIEHTDDPTQITNTDMSRFERDPADYVWLEKALNGLQNDAEKMKKLVQTLTEPGRLDNEIIYALEGIQYFVEDFDLANDLHKVKGFEPVVSLLTHANPQVRMWAAWIVASVTQNHAQTQQIALQKGVLDILLASIPTEPNLDTQNKLVYALSSLLSDKHAIKSFVEKDGIPKLVPLIVNGSQNTRVRKF
eukprot:TRINITY_DN2322_c0_g1_i8.p1 TRINITY_DN2322_c0_g1~~TRINITY_DN2322_c0_g1_i8.p1  ORF type:complete len:201 (+),score=28.88 TRINITY_DN2322_c0_g1_i8:177-779(+)